MTTCVTQVAIASAIAAVITGGLVPAMVLVRQAATDPVYAMELMDIIMAVAMQAKLEHPSSKHAKNKLQISRRISTSCMPTVQ